MNAATAPATITLSRRFVASMVTSSPKVAITSPSSTPNPLRCFVAIARGASSNMKLASATPRHAPASCADDERRAVADGYLARHHCRSRHQRVEVSPGDRCEHDDQDKQTKAGSQAVGEQRNGDVAGREPLTHDPGTDDNSE